MLLLFNKSESLECAKVVVLKLGAILFYSGIHFKPLKLWKKNIRLFGTCRKVPLVLLLLLVLLFLTLKRLQINYIYKSLQWSLIIGYRGGRGGEGIEIKINRKAKSKDGFYTAPHRHRRNA